MKDFDVDIETPPPSSKANNYINWHVHLSCAYFNSIFILFFIAMQMQSAGGKAFVLLNLRQSCRLTKV
jgi:hypothetical protein